MTHRETVAAVVVTYNRADLLERMLAGLAALDRQPDTVVVIDNASSDHTADVLSRATNANLVVLRSEENLGGAGGFHRGVRAAYERGADRIWLMDDDVVPAPDCLTRLLEVDEDCVAAVREDTAGRLVEKAAVRFDLTNPLAIRPKTAMVETTYGERAAMPALVEVENIAFEGFMIHRDVVTDVGLPDPSYFIFYDDVDYALRIRSTGRRIWAVRDAVLVRQLDFDQQHDLSGWKGYYMYRNLFAVHLRYGENALVRLKPWLITLAVVSLTPLRVVAGVLRRSRGRTAGGYRPAGAREERPSGGEEGTPWRAALPRERSERNHALSEARNVIRALHDARGMRTPPRPSVD